MKKYITASLFLFIPFMSMAADRCTNLTGYKIDKRCYVNNAQKQTQPYNATVALVNVATNFVYCTGTIRNFNGVPYIYTANHCVQDLNTLKNTIQVRTQDGYMLTVSLNTHGTYKQGTYTRDRHDDFAIYSISPADYPKIPAMTEFSHNPKNNQNTYQARVIGYGALKIMADAEINQFKQKYKTYLKNQKGITSNGSETQYSWQSGGVNLQSGYGKEFLVYLAENEPSYYKDVFKNSSMLKISYCTFSGAGVAQGCQIWGGNSGGGVFDETGNLMGIIAGYKRTIGGTMHSSASVGDEVINVNFLKNQTNKTEH